MERSFGLLKPDCLKRGLEKDVIALIESAGLDIVAMKKVRLTRAQVDAIWPGCKPMAFHEEMVVFSTSNDCMVFIVEGEDAIGRLSALVGHYDPRLAEAGTIRHRFGISLMENIIHSSFDAEMYQRESSMFFDGTQKLGQ